MNKNTVNTSQNEISNSTQRKLIKKLPLLGARNNGFPGPFSVHDAFTFVLNGEKK